MDDNTPPPARGNDAEGAPHRTPERQPGNGKPTDRFLRRLRSATPSSATPSSDTPSSDTPKIGTTNGGTTNGGTPNGGIPNGGSRNGGPPNGEANVTPRRGPKHAAVEPDEFGAYHYDGDDENGRAPGSALVLVILSLVAGGLYFWQYLPLMRRFDWIRALTLETPAPFVLGGAAVLVFGAILLLRYGMVWASRLACALILAPMLRLLVESIIEGGFPWVGPAIVALLISGAPVLLVLALSFSPALNRWRRRRQEFVKSRRST